MTESFGPDYTTVRAEIEAVQAAIVILLDTLDNDDEDRLERLETERVAMHTQSRRASLCVFSYIAGQRA